MEKHQYFSKSHKTLFLFRKNNKETKEMDIR
jgi:hypothetical protein